jgi:hypothetical protein
MAVYQAEPAPFPLARSGRFEVGGWLAQATATLAAFRTYLSVSPSRPVWILGVARYPWEEPTVRRLARLYVLQASWDGADARPIPPDVLNMTQIVLRTLMRPTTLAPNVVPTVQGGIQLEWHARGLDVELEVLPTGRIEVLVSDLGTHEEAEGSLFSTFRALASAIDRLS